MVKMGRKILHPPPPPTLPPSPQGMGVGYYFVEKKNSAYCISFLPFFVLGTNFLYIVNKRLKELLKKEIFNSIY
jgi:hypothetical protein